MPRLAEGKPRRLPEVGRTADDTRVLMQETLAKIVEGLRPALVFVTHDIDEALVIGDELCIMSRRPGTIIERIHNVFPRTRSAEIYGEPEYGPLKEHIFEVIRTQISGASLRQGGSTQRQPT